MRRAIATLLALAAAVTSGCGAVSTRARDSSLTALATREPAPGRGLEEGDCRGAPYPFGEARLPKPAHMPAGTFMREIQDRGQHRLVVGVDQNSLGLGYFEPISATMQGFDVDVVREVARAIFGNRHRIRYEAISTAQREAAVVTGEVDIVASAFSITCERRTVVDFSSVYHVAHQRLLVGKGSTVSDISDLRGKRVCATRKSTSIDQLAGTAVIPYPVALRSDCLLALQAGAVDAITSDDAILKGFQRQDPQTTIVGGSLDTERYGLAIKRGRGDFVRFVNAVLGRLRRSGCLRAYERHWLGPLDPPQPDPPYERCTKGRR